MAAKLKPEPVKPGVTSPVTGGRQVEWVREESGEHQGNAHFRTIDSLGLMLRNGTITAPMHDAGQEFATVFALAHLNGPSVPTFDRIRGGQWRDSMTERVAFARKRIGQALDAVGGIGSPGGSAVWHVAGVGQSVKDWAAQQGWNGRPLSQPEARGILVAALAMLAMHYGYLRETRGRSIDR
ncbi:hypothetical protein [Accumulibacter sp.]|uniref:hypothetical protein n=1 Tax=Accumulibacter sp. TaxID=2053492 RepID=UPI0026253410|nr:hypothetical protein [Accumulibacter sp.]